MEEIYQTKSDKLPGTSYAEVYKKAFTIYTKIKKQSKRRVYIRSAYFRKDKIFLSIFWQHLKEKINHRDKARRLKYYQCALELIRETRKNPSTRQDTENQATLLHRFHGTTSKGERFFVQIKENKRNREKHLISIFPS